MHAVKELQKDLRSITRISCGVQPQSSAEHVAERHPILLYQYLEALKGAVMWVEHELRQRAELSCTVPPIGAVHQDVIMLHGD